MSSVTARVEGAGGVRTEAWAWPAAAAGAAAAAAGGGGRRARTEAAAEARPGRQAAGGAGA